MFRRSFNCFNCVKGFIDEMKLEFSDEKLKDLEIVCDKINQFANEHEALKIVPEIMLSRPNKREEYVRKLGIVVQLRETEFYDGDSDILFDIIKSTKEFSFSQMDMAKTDVSFFFEIE